MLFTIPFFQVKQLGLACGLLSAASTEANPGCSSGNSEVRFRWLRLGVRVGIPVCAAEALRFLSEQGRMKFVRPLYRDLMARSEFRDRTMETFRINRPTMHATTAQLVAKDIAQALEQSS